MASPFGGGCTVRKGKPAGTLEIESMDWAGIRCWRVIRWQGSGSFDFVAHCAHRWMAEAIVRGDHRRGNERSR
jgi:hypothetical protein